jgi:F-type H+-transporting ATPase subunit gamma
MESLEQLHSQLENLHDLRNIVKTMKSLSAVNIHQYEKAVGALHSYNRTVELGLQVVLQDMKKIPAPQTFQHEQSRMGAIIFGSDHGLCGRFNEEIINHALNSMTTNPDTRLLLAVGSRVATNLEHNGHAVEDNFQFPGSAPLITTTVQQILLKIDTWREHKNVRQVYLFYNRHAKGGSFYPASVLLLPVDLRRFHRLETTPWPSRRLPTFSMKQKQLLSRLLRQYFFIRIFHACAESQASEHASRLSAMQSAERNLNERIEHVTFNYRRARQNSITSELLDIVSGAEAIIGSDASKRHKIVKEC